ncbi:hypothetical protein BU17DRAFT_70537 [Hysterangium stoloniferum]|nr:hypothetical protein BU17DRAFT_70537 [Hysterangium stoloniferum]
MSSVCIPTHNPDPRPLPEGWTAMYDMKYYVNSSIVSSYPVISHPLGPLPARKTTKDLFGLTHFFKESRVLRFLRCRKNKTRNPEAFELPSELHIRRPDQNTGGCCSPPSCTGKHLRIPTVERAVHKLDTLTMKEGMENHTKPGRKEELAGGSEGYNSGCGDIEDAA